MGEVLSKLLCYVVGYMYPAYKTYKAIEEDNESMYMQWLTYWTVHTAFISLEFVFDLILPLWIPFYTQAKLVFYLWLVSPQSNGATLIYKNLIQPYLLKNERTIEQNVGLLRQQFSGLGPQIMRKLQSSSVDIISSAVLKMNELQNEAKNQEKSSDESYNHEEETKKYF